MKIVSGQDCQTRYGRLQMIQQGFVLECDSFYDLSFEAINDLISMNQRYELQL